MPPCAREREAAGLVSSRSCCLHTTETKQLHHHRRPMYVALGSPRWPRPLTPAPRPAAGIARIGMWPLLDGRGPGLSRCHLHTHQTQRAHPPSLALPRPFSPFVPLPPGMFPPPSASLFPSSFTDLRPKPSFERIVARTRRSAARRVLHGGFVAGRGLLAPSPSWSDYSLNFVPLTINGNIASCPFRPRQLAPPIFRLSLRDHRKL